MSSGSELDTLQSPDFDDGSSNDLQVSSHLEYRDGTVPLIKKIGSGHMSPVRARTMKEYDQQIADLQKENFSLKLRIYFLEERMKTQWDGDSEDIFRQNIELKVEVESLKKDLNDKQDLLKKASSALTSVTSHHEIELLQAKETGIAEGQQITQNNLEALKISVELLQKELNTKNQEVENFHIQSNDLEAKVGELLSVNHQLDSRWRQLEREKKNLEMQMEMMKSMEEDAGTAEKLETTSKDVAEEVARKDRLIEQLRCALKAKDIIISQVEEEKKEAIKETTTEFQDKIVQLQAEIETYKADEEMVGRPSDVQWRSPAKSSIKQGIKMKPNIALQDAVAQSPASAAEQRKDSKKSKKQGSQKDREVSQLVERIDREVTHLIDRRDREDLRTIDHLEKNDQSLRQQREQLKAELEDAQKHSASQDQLILRLMDSLKVKDEQMEKILELSDLSNPSQFRLNIKEIIEEMRRESAKAIEEVTEENSLNVKTKNEEISRLRKTLTHKAEEIGRLQMEVETCRQAIADMEKDARRTDHLLHQLAGAVEDQNMAMKEAEAGCYGNDIANREQFINQLMVSLAAKEKSTHGASVNSTALDNIITELQKQVHLKEGLRQAAETEARRLTHELDELKKSQCEAKSSATSLESDETQNQDQTSATENTDTIDSRFYSSRDNKFQQTDEVSSDDSDVGQLMAEVNQLRRLLNERGINTKIGGVDGSLWVDREQQRPIDEDRRGTMDVNDSYSSDTRRTIHTIQHHPNVNIPQSMEESAFADHSPLGRVLTPPRSNISYLSVESSKRYSADDDVIRGRTRLFNSDQVNSITSKPSAYLSLLPDDTTLSQMSPNELKNIIGSLRSGALDQCDGSGETSPVGFNTSDPRSAPRNSVAAKVEIEMLKIKLDEKLREISELNSKLDGARVELNKSEDVVSRLNHELSRVKDELESTEGVNDCLKEQIALNTRGEKSSVQFNPELIVRMAKEIDKMKKELKSMERRGEATGQVVQKVDQSTSTDNLTDSMKLQFVTTKSGLRKDAVDSSKGAGTSKVVDGQSHNDSVTNGMLDQSFMSHIEGSPSKMSGANFNDVSRCKGQQKSHIPVLLKSSKSKSLDDDEKGKKDVCTQCTELAANISTLNSTIKNQAKEIRELQTLLSQLDPQSQRNSIGNQVLDRSSAFGYTHEGRSTDIGAEHHPSIFERSHLTDVSFKLPSGDHESRPSFAQDQSQFFGTPVNDTMSENRQVFMRLQNEVTQLRAQLELSQRENAQLNDTIQMINNGTFCIPNLSPRSREASAAPGEFLRCLVDTLREENELLQRHLDESHNKNNLLRTRLEELSEFLETLLPLMDKEPSLRFDMKEKLSKTQNLLSQTLNDTHDNNSSRMSQTASYFLNVSREPSTMLPPQSLIGRDSTVVESEIEKQQLRLQVNSLDHACHNLEQHLHQKELELVSVATEASDSKSQVEALLMEVETLRRNIVGEKETNSVTMRELFDMKQNTQILQKTLEEARLAVKEVTEEREILNQTNSQLQSALTQSRFKIADLEQELVNIESRKSEEQKRTEENWSRKLTAFGDERELLLTKIESLSSQISELKIEVVRERDRSAAAESTRDGWMAKMKDKDGIIMKLKELLKENQVMAEDLQTQLHRMNEDIQEKKLTIYKLNRRCQDLQNSLIQTDSLSKLDSNSPPEIGDGLTSGGAPHGLLTAEKPESDISTRNDGQKEAWRVNHTSYVPTHDTSELTSVSHLSTTLSGIKTDDIKFKSKLHNIDESNQTEQKSTDTLKLRSRLRAAEDMISLLQTELSLCQRVDRVISSTDGNDEMRLMEELLVEIRQLRVRLQESLQKNDQLTELLTEQLRHNGADGQSHIMASDSTLSFREISEISRSADGAQNEMILYKKRIHQLQSELNMKITQIEASEAEKRSLHRSIDASKQKIESAQAEVVALRESLNESNELNRVMRLELRLHDIISKTENKENEQVGASGRTPQSSGGSPLRHQYSDLATEMRQLRVQMDKVIDNNNGLRQKLEELSENQIFNQSGSGKNLAVNDDQDFAVVERHIYEQLKAEISRNVEAVKKLQAVHTEVINDDQKKDLNKLIQELTSIAAEQSRLIIRFWMLNLSKQNTNTSNAGLTIENELLRKQLTELKQRYAQARHAIKSAQERLDANNKHKAELLAIKKNKKEETIEQINKTHHILVQARQNLEAVHNHSTDHIA